MFIISFFILDLSINDDDISNGRKLKKKHSLERSVALIGNLDTTKIPERHTWNVDMAQYGEYQLEGSKYKRISVGPGKRENKAFKLCIRKENRCLKNILRGESLVKELIKRQMEEKKRRERSGIMLLDSINGN